MKVADPLSSAIPAPLALFTPIASKLLAVMDPDAVNLIEPAVPTGENAVVYTLVATTFPDGAESATTPPEAPRANVFVMDKSATDPIVILPAGVVAVPLVFTVSRALELASVSAIAGLPRAFEPSSKIEDPAVKETTGLASDKPLSANVSVPDDPVPVQPCP